MTFDGGKLVIYRKGKTWCALTRRTGSLYGHRGPTYVRLSDARQPDAVDSGNYLYYAGPVRVQHKQPPLDEYCIIAFGFVELGSHHAQGAKRYCFQYA